MTAISTQSPMPPAPMPPTAARIAGTSLTAAVTIFLLAFPLIVTAAITPKFEQIFKDFGVSLPVTARLFINVGNFLGSPVGWAVVVLAIAAVVVPVSLVAKRRWGFAMALLLLALGWFLGYILLLLGSMFVPLTQMIQSLQTSKP